MTKTITKIMNTNSPKRKLITKKINLQPFNYNGLENNPNIENLQYPHSNNHKKTLKAQEKTGSGRTSDNPQLERERNQTIISGFDTRSNHQDKKQEQNQRHKTETKKDSQYLKFYKYYYEKNQIEHPNWNPTQITKIISLLWKKKKHHQKNPPSKPTSGITSRRSKKPLTAKQLFKINHKDMTREQIDEIWSTMPQQTKKFWKKQGQSSGTLGRLSQVSSVKNSKGPQPTRNTMKSLLNLM